LRDGRTDVDGDVAEDAVLTTLPEFDGLRGFADLLLPFEQTGTKDGEQTFIAVHRSLKGGKSLPGEFEEAGSRAGSFRHPGRAAPDAEGGCLVESTHPRGRKRGEVDAMLVVGI